MNSTSTAFKKWVSNKTVWLILFILVAIVSIASPSFMSGQNLLNLLVAESAKGIIAVGVMWCMLTRGIDLSAGSVVSLAAVVTASLVQSSSYSAKLFPNLPEFPVPVAILIGISVGLLVGLFNGSLVAYAKIPAFIATLGSQIIARGLAQLYTNAYPVPSLIDDFTMIGKGSVLGIPSIVIVFIVCAAISWFMLTQTHFGKNVYAIGGNEIAARVAGINVEKNLVMVYLWEGFCGAVAGIMLASRSRSAISTMGLNYELDAIAAATVGGVSHSGGVGTISGVIAGVLIMGVINNGLLIMQVSPYLQLIVKGVVIVAAVVWDMRRNVKRA